MFGDIMKGLGTVRAEVKNWASTQYAEAIAIASAGLYAEEALTSYFNRLLNLTGTKEFLFKQFGRVVMSAFYYSFLRGWNSLVAITASAAPLLMIGVDGINYLLGKTPSELGESLALGAWAKPTQATTVVYTPAPAPQPTQATTSALPPEFNFP